MEHSNCLNCEKPVENNFCPHCGQKTDTHRITIKHFIAHDLLHGVWHIEKGLFFTLRQAVLRPGKAALEYVNGKRIRYYNVFYLALLLLAADVALLHWFHNAAGFADSESVSGGINKLLASYSKLFLFSVVPLLALNAALVFKRWKLNVAEHFIVAGMALLGILMTTALYLATNTFYELTDFGMFGIFTMLFFFAIPFVPIWTYANAFHSRYSIGGTIWRIFLFYLLIFVEMAAIFATMAIALARNGGDGDFTF